MAPTAKIEAKPTEQRPLWLHFPGVGVQRAHAASDLMRIPVFAASVERAAAALRAHDVDLVWLLTEAPESAFGDVINIMVSIVALQVSLIDVLRAIGLRPDGLFGICLGELGAAYADETLTVEQTILTAYWLARCLAEAELPTSAKVVVYLSWDECQKLSPPDTYMFVKFTENSVLMGGPDMVVENFVTVLSSKGVVTKMVRPGWLFHTEYVDAALSPMRQYLREIIPDPKPRTARWISCLAQEERHSKIGKLCSAEYFTRIIRGLVDMSTPLKLMAKNAVLVEVSAGSRMFDHMKPSLPASVTTIPLVRKETLHSTAHLFHAVIQIYEALGEQPPVEQLSAVFGPTLNEELFVDFTSGQ